MADDVIPDDIQLESLAPLPEVDRVEPGRDFDSTGGGLDSQDNVTYTQAEVLPDGASRASNLIAYLFLLILPRWSLADEVYLTHLCTP